MRKKVSPPLSFSDWGAGMGWFNGHLTLGSQLFSREGWVRNPCLPIPGKLEYYMQTHSAQRGRFGGASQPASACIVARRLPQAPHRNGAPGSGTPHAATCTTSGRRCTPAWSGRQRARSTTSSMTILPPGGRRGPGSEHRRFSNDSDPPNLTIHCQIPRLVSYVIYVQSSEPREGMMQRNCPALLDHDITRAKKTATKLMCYNACASPRL